MLQHLYPSAPPVKPAMKAGQSRPHILSVDPWSHWAFRVRTTYYEEWRGAVDNIHYQSMLIGLRGNLRAYSHYKPSYMQRSGTAVAYIFETPGAIQQLG